MECTPLAGIQLRIQHVVIGILWPEEKHSNRIYYLYCWCRNYDRICEYSDVHCEPFYHGVWNRRTRHSGSPNQFEVSPPESRDLMVGLYGVLIGFSYCFTDFITYGCSFARWLIPMAISPFSLAHSNIDLLLRILLPALLSTPVVKSGPPRRSIDRDRTFTCV